MKINDFEHALEIAKTLEEGGGTEHSVAKIKCEAFWDTGDIPILQELLDEYPGIHEEALRNIEEQTHWEEKEPFRKYYNEDRLDALKGEIKMGITIPGDAEVGINTEDLTQILAIYGVPKTGKTWAQILMLRQIFNMPNRKFNTILVDRKSDYIHLIKEYPHLWVLGAEKNMFNIFEEKEDWFSAVQVISDENYFGATSQPIIEAAAHKCLIKNGLLRYRTIGENGTWLDDADLILKYLGQEFPLEIEYTDSDNYPTYSQLLFEVNQYAKKMKFSGPYTKDTISKIKTRLGQYIRPGEVFNCKKGFPLDFWLNNDIIIVPNEQMNRTVLRTFIVGLAQRIFRHFKKHNMRGDELRTLFILDEGGWLFDAERDWNDYATSEALDDLLRMGREFGLGWIVGAQQPNMVCKTVRQNARYLISFRVQSGSMDEVQKDFGLDDELRDYMKHQIPSKLVGIYSSPNYPGPMLFRVPEGE